MRFVAIGAALALSLFGPAALAQPQPEDPPSHQQAQAAGQADVLVLHATNEGKGIGDKIKKLPYQLPQLSKPPLSAYDTYVLLSNSQLPLKQNESKSLTLPGDSTLKLKLEDVKAPSKPEGKTRYVLRTSVTKAGGKKLTDVKVTAQPKVFFFVAGPAYKNGVLVIGIRVLPQ